MLLALRNATDVTQLVRDARQSLGIIIGVAFMLSIQLSLFLARTIVQPLRALVRAAVRVRLGRDRAVVVPRLPDRGDEIGLLARAFSDMTTALRQRIDAVETLSPPMSRTSSRTRWPRCPARWKRWKRWMILRCAASWPPLHRTMSSALIG